jgi:hypothetical protein
VDDLVDSLLGQVRRARRQGEAASGLPPGTKRALGELADDAAHIEEHSAALLKALGAETTAPQPKPPPGQSASAAPASERATPPDDRASADEIVRSLAIDLRLEGHPRDEVRRRLEQTFGAAHAAEVVDEVFDR